jgi:hypothetical protein
MVGPWRSYKELIAALAERIVEAQRPIRVLQALRWDGAVEERFLGSKQREMPAIDATYYAKVDLGFDPRQKEEEFEEIARDVDRDIGGADEIGKIMTATALEYRDVVRMLTARGTPAFYDCSRKLYGSPKDTFPDGRSTVRDLGQLLYGLLTNVDEWSTPTRTISAAYARTLDAVEAARQLGERLATFFGDTHVRVEPDDGILADAAAGSDYVKVRSGAWFSPRDVDILEVHEGWVHVATSLNGQAQPVDVFDWFRTEGYEEVECFHNARRVFRGGVLGGGAPFTKDACYCKGIVLNYAFIRSAIQHDRVDLIPYLFVGKVAHEDVPVLARRVSDGVVKPPGYLPPMFRDLNGLAIWMAYSTFFSQLGAEAIAEHYGRLFEG